MKTIKNFTLALALMVISFTANAQTNPQLYVIIQHADNSAAYYENAQRLNSEIIDKYSSNNKIVFVSYNVTSDEITAKTSQDFDWYAVYNSAYETKGQEGIVIMDPANKSILARFDLSAGTRDILKSIAEGSQTMVRSYANQ